MIRFSKAADVIACAESIVGSVLPFLEGQPFEPELLVVLCAAFDRAFAGMDDSAGSRLTKEIIAKRIIAKAKTGERDMATLINYGLFDIDAPAGSLERESG